MNRHCPIIVALSGFLVLATGILCTWYAFPKLIQTQIDQNIALREGTQSYSMWQKQSFPLFYKIHFFNVSNPVEVMNGAKPILKEVGPYVYDLHIERQIIAIDEGTDTIKYHLKKHYVFNAKASACRSDEDAVTIVNMVLMGTILKVHSIMPSLVGIIIEALPYLYPGISDIFLRAKVKDLLFDGVTLYCNAPEISNICMMMKAALPTNMKVADNDQDFVFSMFGVFNDTLLGPFNMTRGLKHTTRGELVEFDDSPELETWRDEGVCNMINGSDSGVYFPMKSPVDTIYSFVPEICRSVGVYFDKELVKSGLTVYRYAATEKSLSHDGLNQCFCDLGDDDEVECPAEGVINLEPCLKAPVLMSNPHFYLGNKGLLEYVSGLKPDSKLHESYLLIEPKTATPLEGAKRTQMNTQMQRFNEFPMLENISEGVFPILWLEEGVVLPDDLKGILTSSFQKMAILDIIKWGLIAVGIVLMLISFVLLMYLERLMCFATSVKVSLNDDKAMFTTRNSSLPLSFNTSVVYPMEDQSQPGGGNRNEDGQNRSKVHNWPVDQRFT